MGCFFLLGGVLLLTGFDQLTKFLAIRFLQGQPDCILIPGVFQLTYLENRGAAWGLMGGMRWLFLIFTLLAAAAVFFLWKRVPGTAKYRPFRVLAVLFLAGAFGNALDRLLRGYVIDFFYFSLIDFPVFNVADCFVCVSLALTLILYRNEDFSWMNRRS